MSTIFTLRVLLKDDQNREISKLYQSKVFTGADLGADILLADAAADALMSDLAALSGLGIVRSFLSVMKVGSQVITAGANKDEGLTMIVEKPDSYKAVVKVPAPPQSIFDGNGNLDIADPLATDYIANFLVGADWTVSDGEFVSELISGSLDE